MAEIINVDFKNRRRKNEKSADMKTGSEGKEKDQSENKLTLTPEVLKKIRNLAASPTTVGIREEIVETYTDDDLLRWLAKAGDSDFERRPAFYKAVAQQIIKRIKIIRTSE